MHRNLYVCDLTKIQTGPKFTRKKVISQELFNLGSPNLVKAWTASNLSIPVFQPACRGLHCIALC